jgi:hypothetical protein
MACRHERMSHEFSPQRGVGVTCYLKRKNHRHGIEITRHRKSSAGLPSPNLRRNIIKGPDLPAAFHRQAAFPHRRGEPQVQTGIIHKANRPRTMFRDPPQRFVEQRAEERIIFQHLHDTDDRRRGKIVQQLRPGGSELRPAQCRNYEARVFGAQFAHQGCRVFVTGMFTGNDQNIHTPARRRRQTKR